MMKKRVFPAEICHPPQEMMEAHIAAVMEATGAKSLFVASDNPIGTAELRFLREDYDAKTLAGGLRDSDSGYCELQ